MFFTKILQSFQYLRVSQIISQKPMQELMGLLVQTGKMTFICDVLIVVLVEVHMMEVVSGIQRFQCNLIDLSLFLQPLPELLPLG